MATHIVASSLPPKKAVEFSRYRIVKPAWIMDSIRSGKLLPWTDYRVLDEGPRQKLLHFDANRDFSQRKPPPRRGYREQTDDSFYSRQINSAVSTLDHSLMSAPSPPRKPNEPPVQAPPSGQVDTAKDESFQQEIPSNQLTPTNPAKLRPSLGSIPDFLADDALEKHSTDLSKPEPKPITVERPVILPMTSEEHNAQLLTDPRLRKSSTANPDFLKQFYSESRLHHLSTWKAGLKSSLQRLASAKGAPRRNPGSRSGLRAYIMHVDFDCFFCAVSLKQRPDLAEKPAAVAHSSGPSSEIASCNYPARRFGIKNGIWMKRALELCPDLAVLPYDFPAYEEASRLFYEAILSVGGIVQSVSVDEALVDVTEIVASTSASGAADKDGSEIIHEQQAVDGLARDLRSKIKTATGCDVSVGIGGNILQAKLALRKAKPAGQFQLKPEQVLDMIGELKAEELPGVSFSIGGKLADLGVRLAKDVRAISRARLVSALGPKTAERIADYCRGIDRSEVGEQPPRKSVSAEVNWGIRFTNQQEAEDFVHGLCSELEKRLLGEQMKGTQLTMKIMRRRLDAPLDTAKHLGHGKCDVFSRSTTFGVATHSGQVIGKEAVSILRSFRFSPGDLRGLGVQMTKLEAIRSGVERPDGSQRRLSFAAFGGLAAARRSPYKKEAIDDVESPARGKRQEGRDILEDPILEEPLTPRRPRSRQNKALSRAGEEVEGAVTPLNVSGTQFIIPSNADPAVMAELPSDIRNRLVAQGQPSAVGSNKRAGSGTRMPSPGRETVPSQVDADVFMALPDDVKAEVLREYKRDSGRVTAGPSPKKGHLEAAFEQQRRPSKGRRFRSVAGKGTGGIQTSFMVSKGEDEGLEADEVEELDPEFLAELPAEVRDELLADHRRRRLSRRSGLRAPTRKHGPHETESGRRDGRTGIRFRGPPAVIPFSQAGVTSTREIKEWLKSWHRETREEGPHDGDRDYLGSYLRRVVLEERDLEKVVVLVRWLDLLVEAEGADGEGRASWRRAMERVKGEVQGAMKQRGLGPLKM